MRLIFSSIQFMINSWAFMFYKNHDNHLFSENCLEYSFFSLYLRCLSGGMVLVPSLSERTESVFCFHPNHRNRQISKQLKDEVNKTLMCWYIPIARSHAAVLYAQQRGIIVVFSFHVRCLAIPIRR